MKIKYLLDEEEKIKLRERLDEVLEQKGGLQVIILWDKNKLTDYYQNICGEHLLEKIEKSSRNYSEQSNNKLVTYSKPEKEKPNDQ